MAYTQITPVLMSFDTPAALPTTSAVDSTGKGAEIPMSRGDQKLLIYIYNANAATAKTATFKAGSGALGMDDKAFSIPSQGTKLLAVESGRYMQSNGKLLVVGESTDIQVGAVFLP